MPGQIGAEDHPAVLLIRHAGNADADAVHIVHRQMRRFQRLVGAACHVLHDFLIGPLIEGLGGGLRQDVSFLGYHAYGNVRSAQIHANVYHSQSSFRI